MGEEVFGFTGCVPPWLCSLVSGEEGEGGASRAVPLGLFFFNEDFPKSIISIPGWDKVVKCSA